MSPRREFDAHPQEKQLRERGEIEDVLGETPGTGQGRNLRIDTGMEWNGIENRIE